MTSESTLVRSEDLDVQVTTLTEQITNLAWDNEILQESLTILQYQLEREGWTTLGGGLETELTRDALKKINDLARAMWLKNPLIQRGVNVQAYYVFGQGVEVSAEDEEVDEVVQAFWNDAKNQAELTLHQALLQKEQSLTLFGNLYFVLFVGDNGRVLVRTIPVSEVRAIVCNPEDAKDPWWYRREYRRLDLDGKEKSAATYYKDWRYMGKDKPKGKLAQGATFETAPVFHVKVGCLDDMKFGVSEVYAALDWARAYKNFLEDWATIVRAYARFAWSLKVNSRQGVVSAKAKFETTISSSGTRETNPPPVTGATFIGQPGVGMQPIRTAGATTSAEDGRRLLLMVASSMGIPETFFGDVRQGTLATAKSLDRPTELKFVSRQTLWHDTLVALLDYVVVQAVEAGTLKGTVTEEEDGTPSVELQPPTITNAKGDQIDRSLVINVDFPPVLEHDVEASVDAIIAAATLNGSSDAGTIDPESITRMLLTALGEKDIQEVMDILYSPGWEEKVEREKEQMRQQFASTPEEPPEEDARAKERFTAALTKLDQAVAKLVEG